MNSRAIADSFNEEIQKMNPENEKTTDTMPVIVIGIIIYIGNYKFYIFFPAWHKRVVPKVIHCAHMPWKIRVGIRFC